MFSSFVLSLDSLVCAYQYLCQDSLFAVVSSITLSDLRGAMSAKLVTIAIVF